MQHHVVADHVVFYVIHSQVRYNTEQSLICKGAQRAMFGEIEYLFIISSSWSSSSNVE